MDEGRGRAGERCAAAVRRRIWRPFRFEHISERERDVIASWADGTLDISQDAVLLFTPRVLKVIVASQFGWSAVSTRPMDMPDMLIAAQLMSEERVGKAVRKHHREANAREDAARRRMLGVVS